ncbi:MAG: hypothetical protein D6680_10315 [Cyanobacteria bacterium J007]|jgi:hypothetical protein|nr:MAG: hypothetical protein D6680_10315 [Cyanobacteria bacterium J007]
MWAERTRFEIALSLCHGSRSLGSIAPSGNVRERRSLEVPSDLRAAIVRIDLQQVADFISEIKSYNSCLAEQLES